MLYHPQPDPVALEIFGLSIHWYGLLYLIGLAIASIIGHKIIRHQNFIAIRHLDVHDIILASALGLILGGRIGYILFYNFPFYIDNPWLVLQVWKGGMSFHGGLLGGLVAMWIVARKQAKTHHYYPTRRTFVTLLDFALVLTPPGLACGRIGNFINGELPGRVASMDLPWAMIFGDPDNLPRHPSPLYQMLVEGFLLAAIMLFLVKKPRHAGWLTGVFLIAYGGGRFFTEYFRAPDSHLGLLVFDLSMGQLLTIPMILLGIVFIRYKHIAGAKQPLVDTLPPCDKMEESEQ